MTEAPIPARHPPRYDAIAPAYAAVTARLGRAPVPTTATQRIPQAAA
ncbi:hypothetical protein [Pseudonocardia xishanensis]